LPLPTDNSLLNENFEMPPPVFSQTIKGLTLHQIDCPSDEEIPRVIDPNDVENHNLYVTPKKNSRLKNKSLHI